MATHSSILAWRIPWTQEPGGLQSMGSKRVRLQEGQGREESSCNPHWFLYGSFFLLSTQYSGKCRDVTHVYILPSLSIEQLSVLGMLLCCLDVICLSKSVLQFVDRVTFLKYESYCITSLMLKFLYWISTGLKIKPKSFNKAFKILYREAPTAHCRVCRLLITPISLFL